MFSLGQPDQAHTIIDETRRSIIDALLAIGNLRGDKQYHEFAKIICPTLPDGTISEIARHMDRFDDWPESYLLNTIIDYLQLSDTDFLFLLEQYVNPNIHHCTWNTTTNELEDIPNVDLANLVNQYLEHDGYKLTIHDTIGDKVFFKAVSTRVGVSGSVKNIIFAAKYKPEIVFDDALNNDIRITRNEDQCLIYNKPIPTNGVMWNELVSWYSEQYGISVEPEKQFILRLCDCLDTSFKSQGASTGPETWMLQAYYDLKKELGMDLPALIPQVYLYYDPQTQRERGYKLFEHQKMDFLIIFSHRDRVVIEIDGKQHYSNGDKASPKLYSEMMKAHREMSLYGYDVYRFGGYEFMGADRNKDIEKLLLNNLKGFFKRLFKKYGVIH